MLESIVVEEGKMRKRDGGKRKRNREQGETRFGPRRNQSYIPCFPTIKGSGKRKEKGMYFLGFFCCFVFCLLFC